MYLFPVNLTCPLLFTHSLKRTTDVMFGGKQVLVCGYGEVGGRKFPNAFLLSNIAKWPASSSKPFKHFIQLLWGGDPATLVEKQSIYCCGSILSFNLYFLLFHTHCHPLTLQKHDFRKTNNWTKKNSITACTTLRTKKYASYHFVFISPHV